MLFLQKESNNLGKKSQIKAWDSDGVFPVGCGPWPLRSCFLGGCFYRFYSCCGCPSSLSSFLQRHAISAVFHAISRGPSFFLLIFDVVINEQQGARRPHESDQARQGCAPRAPPWR